MLAAVLTALSATARGEPALEFDPAFLELGGGQGGADLSVYATSNRVLPGVYLVSVLVNGEAIDRRDVAFGATGTYEGREDALPCLTARMFDEWGVDVAAFPRLAQAGEDACVDIADSVPYARIDFDSYRLQLNVTIPQAALKRRARGSVDPARWDQGIDAALLDYQLSAAQYAGGNFASANSRTTLYAGLRGGINLGAWRVSHTSSFLRGLDGRNRFQVINTFAQRDIADWNSRLMAGEGTTPANIFDGFQFLGVQLNTDETMLPDSLRGYAPNVHGVAQTNAQVTIKQNGFVIYSTYVPPGPFTIDDLYPTSSSGNLEVTITEADGHVTTFTQPYSAVPMLLRDGSWRYNVTAGRYRDGISGSHPSFAMATVARGLPAEFSLYGGFIGAGMYQAALVGVGKNLGNIGAVSFDVTHARSAVDLADSSTVSGHAFRVLYAKAVGSWGTDFRLLAYRYSSAGYRSFADAVQLRDGSEPAVLGAKHQRLEGTVNQRLGRFGSMYATVVVQTYWGSAAHSTVYQLGHSGTWGARQLRGLFGLQQRKRRAVELERVVVAVDAAGGAFRRRANARNGRRQRERFVLRQPKQREPREPADDGRRQQQRSASELQCGRRAFQSVGRQRLGIDELPRAVRPLRRVDRQRPRIYAGRVHGSRRHAVAWDRIVAHATARRYRGDRGRAERAGRSLRNVPWREHESGRRSGDSAFESIPRQPHRRRSAPHAAGRGDPEPGERGRADSRGGRSNPLRFGRRLPGHVLVDAR